MILLSDVVFEKQLQANGGETAVELVATGCELSRADSKRAMQAGAVWLTRGSAVRRLRRAKSVLQPGDEIGVYFNPALIAGNAAHTAELIADEGDYSLWYKPGGVFTQGTKWGDANSIERIAELALERPIRIVHRLDRHTSGVMLLAHNKRAAAGLSALFAERKIAKNYQAIVIGKFPAEELLLDNMIDAKPARSTATLLKYDNGFSLVSVTIDTGRKHQVRRHLADAGYPIVGDRMFGSEPASSREPLQLCAAELSFVCPLSNAARYYRSPKLPALKPSS